MTPNVMRSIWSKRLLRYAAVSVVVLLAIYLVWAFLRGPRSSDVVAAIALLVFGALVINFRRAEITADREIAERIRTEFSAADQPDILALYSRLKTKELEGLFQKVLDDAHGDLAQAQKLTGLAESLGWRAFLENRW